MWQRVKHLLVWLRRVRYCRGFGIQSPTDYWFVRYVVNEHWPYYQYAEIGSGDDWLRRKLGRLYLRLANWRQPRTIVTDDYEPYFAAGCRHAALRKGVDGTAELVRLPVEEDFAAVLDHTDDRSLLVVEGIWRDKARWLQLVADERAVVTYDLYYCGLILFDSKREKQHYIINF